jgi:uncharacterized membrane protein
LERSAAVPNRLD